MAVAALPTAEMTARTTSRAASRARAIKRFKLSLLLPLIVLFLLVLTPVLLLQLYFSFHQWTVYLSTWWDAEYVGFDLFHSVLTDPRFGWAALRSLCARAASGHATAAPPSSVMNSRRIITRSPRRR